LLINLCTPNGSGVINWLQQGTSSPGATTGALKVFRTAVGATWAASGIGEGAAADIGGCGGHGAASEVGVRAAGDVIIAEKDTFAMEVTLVSGGGQA